MKVVLYEPSGSGGIFHYTFELAESLAKTISDVLVMTKDGYELSDDVLYNSNVFITPGGIFGDAGNKYVRVSLCATVEKFEEAIKRLRG